MFLENASSEDRGRAIFEELESILNDPEYLKLAKAKPGEIPAGVLAILDARDAQKEHSLKETAKSGVIQFPMPWDEDKRGVPSAILRSALFGVVKRGRRAYIKAEKLISWGNTTLKYTGEKLMQSDQDVWMSCVEACKREGKTDIVIPLRELIRLSGRKGGDTKRLWNDLTRLVANAVEIKDGRYTYMGSLIHDAVKNEDTGHIALSINPRMLSLFGGNVTHIDNEKRMALKLDLSKWLQGYICSHQSTFSRPHFIGLDKLYNLCGSEVSTIRNFRVAIRKAMTELQGTGVIAGWKLEADVLKFWRPLKEKKK